MSNTKQVWLENAVYFAECLTCGWSSGDTEPSHVGARAMDHARRLDHHVLTHRTIEYDFRRGSTPESK